MTDTNDLRCAELVELVTPYLDGTLDAETTRRVEAGLAVCEGCTRYLEQVRQTISTLGELPTQTLPGDAREALLNAFRRSAP